MRAGKPSAERDQHPTVFTEILRVFLDAVPGATAAVLVDGEGETVDYASELVPFYARVAAAHLRIVTGDVQRALDPSHGSTHEITIRCKGRTFFVRSLPDGYALVVVLKRRAFSISPRALAIAERDLSKEAGWPAPAPQSPFWHPIEVEPSATNRTRPHRVRVQSSWQSVDVLGALVGLRHQRGYRCRLASGAELTLIREAGGAWYADELILDDEGSRPPPGTWLFEGKASPAQNRPP